MKDAKKLADTATEYYRRTNVRNRWFDAKDPRLNAKNGRDTDDWVERGRTATWKLVRELEKQYGEGNVRAWPVFEKKWLYSNQD